MAVTQQINAPAEFIQDLAKDYGTQLAGLTAVPMDTSQFAPSVAAQDPLQAQAASLAASGVGSYQPFLSAAQTSLAGAQDLLGPGAGTGAGSISSFMSPYQSSVIDTTLSEFDRNRAIQEQNIRSQQAGLGQLGAGRAGVQLAEYGAGADRQRAALQAQLLQQGFGQASAARQQDFGNRLGIMAAQSGFAQALPSLQRGDISTLGSVGAIQQAQAQAQLEAQRQANQLAAFEPQTRLDTYGRGITQLISGYPASGSQFTQTPNLSPLETALGFGLGVADIFGKVRGNQ